MAKKKRILRLCRRICLTKRSATTVTTKIEKDVAVVVVENGDDDKQCLVEMAMTTIHTYLLRGNY